MLLISDGDQTSVEWFRSLLYSVAGPLASVLIATARVRSALVHTHVLTPAPERLEAIEANVAATSTPAYAKFILERIMTLTAANLY
jgi:hypothetical protein